MNKKAIALTFVLMGILTAFFAYERRNRLLSEVPRETASTETPTVSESTILIDVILPFDQLSRLADSAVPKTFNGSGNGPDSCTGGFFKVCVGTKYDYSVNRGAIAVSQGPNNTLRIAVPVDISGHGGFRGDGAKLLGLDAKTFTATVLAYADVGLSLSADWCPRPKVNTGFEWIEGAKVEIVGGVWIGISKQVQDSLKDALQAMGTQAASAIKCDYIKREVLAVWQTRSYPLSVARGVPETYVTVTPTGFGFSGIRTTPTAATLNLLLDAKLSVTESASAPQPVPLPAPQVVPFGPGTLKLAMPLAVSYKAIVNQLDERLGRRPLHVQTPSGVATITPREFRVYPSGDRLVIGARFDADLPEHWLDVRGWVYLTAKPVVSKRPAVTALTALPGESLREVEWLPRSCKSTDKLSSGARGKGQCCGSDQCAWRSTRARNQ